MKLLAALVLMVCLLPPAQAQPPRYGHREGAQRPMPPPERRMGWDERQRMREQVRNGQMSREEARERWRERRGTEPVRSPEERERLRRDVIDANRDLYRR
jgi:hypothetical protein